MGSYLDSSDAPLITLTRLRRAEHRATLVAQAPRLRIQATGRTAEFHSHCAPPGSSSTRRKSAMQAWRRRMWKAGHRKCFYCHGQMTQVPKFGDPPPSSVTVDHRVALTNDGADHELNWVMCCSRCNNRKGSMSEAEFRSVLAMTAAPVAVAL